MSDSDADDMYGSGDEAAGSDGDDMYGAGASEAEASASASASASAAAGARLAPRMYPPPFADEAAATVGSGYTVLGRQMSYDVYADEELAAQLDEMVEDFCDITGAARHVGAAVLAHCKFAPELAKSQWFDDGGAALMAATHVLPSQDPPPPPEEWEGAEAVDCPVCFDEVPPERMDALPCGHWACRECWAGHVSALAGSKAELLSAACMECKHPVSLRLMQAALASRPDLKARWTRWRLAEFAAEDSTTRACPVDGCTFVCKYPKGVARDVICPTGHIFCFGCGQEGHAPASCSDARAWRKASTDSGLDVKWIAANTRPCPKCGVVIEKNQGCQFMRCGAHAHSGVIAKGSGCGFQFCWICMKASSVGSHSGCDPWVPSAEAKMADKELQAFARTTAHFDGNMTGRDEALKLLPALRETMVTLSTRTGRPLHKLAHLEEAVHEVAEGRRTVAWSYIWQHYHASAAGSQAALFLHNQSTLHEQLERLQQLVEGAPGEASVSAAVAAVGADTLSAADMELLTRNGLEIRALLGGVRKFRADVVRDVQVATAHLESAGLARSTSATA